MKFLHTFTKGGLLLASLMLFSSLALAQRTVKGRVTDAESGEGLIGATVSVVGTTRGASTDVDGNYSVEVPAGSLQLRFAYTGYAEEVVNLGASDIVNIALKPGTILDEVVVVGYGTVKKSDLTGSVVSVGEKDFNQGLVTAPDQLIQGKAAGVQIVNNSGQPGAATTVRIRGNSSIRAGNEPLFVVDGVQLTGASTKPGTNAGDLGATPGSNPLNYLNPNDIESIQVLKDASATAIYGSRGANGVIIITTKKGKSGTPSINFSTSVGASSILRKYDVLDAGEYRAALRDYGLTAGDYGSDVDAMDEILRTGFVQNHNVSVSGGSDAGTYRVGLNYFDQDGIVKSNDLRRLSANIVGSYKFFESKRLGLDFNLITAQTRENGPAVTTNAGFRGSLIGNALQWNPTHAMYDQNGDPIVIPQFGNFTNPVALLDAYSDQSNTVDVIASIAPSYKITDELTYKFFYSVNHGSGDRRTQVKGWINIQDIENRGLASIYQVKNTNQILTHTINYNTMWGRNLSVNAVAGYEYQKRTERGNGLWARDFAVDAIDYINVLQTSSPGSRNVFGFSPPDAELQSYFVRANFNLNDKYLLTGTLRADGSSKFGENNKYGYFPAVGLAWNMHNESFLKDGPFDNLKLRLGWGITGNSEFPPGAAQERYFLTNTNNAPDAGLENVANPDLKWETTTTTNVGLDFAIMNYKLYGTIEYFNRSATDLLFQFPTIQPAPAAFYWINLPGNIVNSGLELSLNTLIIDREKFSWNFGANAAFMKNEVKNYDGPELPYGTLFGQGTSEAVSQRLVNGQPLNAFYLRQHIQIGEDGQSQYVGGADETLAFVGDANPNVILGFYTGVNIDKLSINLNFNGLMGHQIYNNTKMSVIPIGNLGSRNIDATLLEGPNREATSNAIKPSDRYLENGDYLKLANATVSYNIGNIGKGVKNVRVYLTGQNLLLFTGYNGFDPEVNTVNVGANGLPSAGIEYIPYPSARTVILGANFTF